MYLEAKNLYDHGRYRDAYILLRPFLTASTDIRTTKLMLELSKILKHYDDAIYLSRKILSVDPEYVNANAACGIAFYYKGLYNEANKELNIYFKKVQSDPEACLVKGLLAIKIQKDVALAMKIFCQALSICKNESLKENIYVELCNASILFSKILKYNNSPDALKASEAAIVNLDKAISLFPSNSELHSQKGGLLYIKNDFQGAIDSYLTSISCNPKDVTTYNSLSVVYNKLNQNELALKYLDEALAIDKKCAETYFNFGCIYKDTDERKALEYFNKTVEIEPLHKFAFYSIGNIHKILGQLDQAIESYKKAIKNNPTFTQNYCRLASVLTASELDEEATVYFMKGLEMRFNEVAKNNEPLKVMEFYTLYNQSPDEVEENVLSSEMNDMKLLGDKIDSE